MYVLRIKKLDIFILKSFGFMFIGTFFICLFIFIMQFLWLYVDDMVGKGLSIGVLAKFFYYAALTLVPQSLPLAILLASLITFGNFGERLELLAMKAAGIPLIHVMRPLIIVCFGLGVVSFYFQNITIPNAKLKLQTLLVSMKQKSPELEIPEGVFYDGIENYNLYVKKKDTKTGMLYGVVIYNFTDGFDNAHIIKADSGRLETTADKQYLRLKLYAGEQFENLKDGQINARNIPYRREMFAEKTTLIEFSSDFDVMDGDFLSGNACNKNMRQLSRDIDSLVFRQDSLGRDYYQTLQMSSYASYEMNASDTAKLLKEYPKVAYINVDSIYNSASKETRQEWLRLEKSKVSNMKSEFTFKNQSVFNADKNIRRHQIEWFNKITLSLACLVFFFIGAPLGAIIRKGGLGMPVIVSVFTFIVYYIIDTSGAKLAREGEMAVWLGRWLSTFVLAPLGFFLTYKANKDSVVFNVDMYKNFFNKVLGLRVKRHLTIKEVVIDEPDNDHALVELEALKQDCMRYGKEQLACMAPNYVRFFMAKSNTDRALWHILSRLNDFVEHMGNSRNPEIINKLNQYPVVAVSAHYSPFPKQWINILVGALFPIGLFFYVRAWIFRRRLYKDLQQIITISNDLENIIHGRKNE